MQFRTGWYSKADANGGVGVGINKAGCWIGFANYNGSDYKTNSTITVYFR